MDSDLNPGPLTLEPFNHFAVLRVALGSVPLSTTFQWGWMWSDRIQVHQHDDNIILRLSRDSILIQGVLQRVRTKSGTSVETLGQSK